MDNQNVGSNSPVHNNNNNKKTGSVGRLIWLSQITWLLLEQDIENTVTQV